MAKSMIAQKAERTPWPIDTTTPDQERGFLREMEPDDDSAAHALRAGGQVLKRYPDGRFFSWSPHTPLQLCAKMDTEARSASVNRS